jgi:photoactive yellow protein
MMLEPSQTPTPSSFSPNALDSSSDAEIDALPFGVIGLSADGTVRRYNLYESLLARLDRAQVLGRNFFRDIAPCTNGPDFQARFASVVSGQRDADRFDFVFDFRFGAQEVGVEIVKQATGDGAYLIINRKRILLPRSGVDPARLAAAQRDLAPGETREGVRRDELERRIVEAPAPLFAALRATCDKLAPETWSVFATEWGVAWGRRAAVDLEMTALSRWNKTLREVPMSEVATLFADTLAEQGWGRLVFDFAQMTDGLLSIEVYRSALAEAAPPRGTNRRSPACHLLAGFLGGLLSHVAQRRLLGREIACAASGPGPCEFVIVSATRRKELDAALERGVIDAGGLGRFLAEGAGRAAA